MNNKLLKNNSFLLKKVSFIIRNQPVKKKSLINGILTFSCFLTLMNCYSYKAEANNSAKDLWPEGIIFKTATDPRIQPDNSFPSDSSITKQLQQDELPRKDYYYINLGLGIGFPNTLNGNHELVRKNQSYSINLNQDLDSGFAGELAGGYQFEDSRVELAIGTGNFGANQGRMNVSTLGHRIVNNPISGSVNYVSVMANAYYDIPTGSKFRPYIGLGAGYAHVTIISRNGTHFVGGGSVGTFAYQAKVGLSYEVIPKGSMFVETAYLGTTGFSASGINYDPVGATRVVAGWKQGF